MKRFMSFILAAAMVVGLIPAVFAADTTVAEECKYVFTNAAHTGSSANAANVTKFEEDGEDQVHTLATTVEAVSKPWGYVAQSFPNGTVAIGTDPYGARLSFNRPGKRETSKVTFNPDADETITALCLEIEIENGGTFIPKFEYVAAKYGPIVELYLVPKNGTTVSNDNLSEYVKNLDAKYRLGISDTSTGEADTFRSLTLASGNYYFIIVPNGENEDVSAAAIADTKSIYYHYCQPKSLTLSPVTKTASYTYDFNYLNGKNVNNVMLSAENAGYENTGGMWAYTGIGVTWMKTQTSYGVNIGTSESSPYAVLRVKIPYSGTYAARLIHHMNQSSGGKGDVYLLPASADVSGIDKILANENKLTVAKNVSYYNAGENIFDTATPASAVSIPVAGEYYLVFHATGSDSGTWGTYPHKLVLEEVTTQPGDAEVNINPGNAEAESDKATISNDVSVLAKDIDGNEIENAVTVSGNTATAEKTVGDYEFLYWAKGIGKNQKKVSTDLTYSFTNESEKLWLFAIYRNTKTAAKNATFYNANGDIIASVEITDGKVTTPSLTEVSLAGYGEAKGWKYAFDGATYDENQEVTVSGDALFVAEYDEPNTSIDITVKNGTMVVEGEKAFPVFGDKVTVTAPARKDNTKLFNYWKKDGEIVSFEKSYTFVAWKKCTLEAVYTDYVPLAESVRKIILGNDGNTYVAEFIGFDGDDVLERGIAFATSGDASCASINRAVMNRKDLNHLAAIDDIGATSVVGYVIDKQGNVYYSK